MKRSWSDPQVRTCVKAIVAGVQEQLRQDQAAGEAVDSYDRHKLAELVLANTRRLRTGSDTPLLDQQVSVEDQQDIWKTARQAATAEVAGLGRLQPLLDDDSIQDIHVNGCDDVWVIRTDGSKHAVDPVADSDDDLIELGRTIARRHGREGEQEWSETAPVAEVTLESGHRVELMRDVVTRPSIAIRNPDYTINRVSHLVDFDTIHPKVADMLSAAVRAGTNVLVAGGTKAGKTTTMRCLLNEIPPHERIVTIEDNRELAIGDDDMLNEDGKKLHDDVVEIVTRRGNAEGAGRFTLSDGLRASKRMNPDRLVVGEVRSVEAAEMIDAMIGEAGGSICTVHAKSAREALDRLTYLSANHAEMSESTAQRMIAGAVDLVCWQLRDPATGRRWVAEVAEVEGTVEGDQILLNPVYNVDADGRVTGSGPTNKLAELLRIHGWRG